MSKQSEKYRTTGKCVLCGKLPPRENKATCYKCGERYRKYSRIRANNFIITGKCCECGKKKLVTKRHCGECVKKHKKSSTKSYFLVKDKVFMAYGGYCCACCKEEEKAFLTIDHINNDGYKHRKEIGQSNTYRWLKDNNYPPGFQVLCMNCQWGKMHYGICPHKLYLKKIDDA
jgi:hypothetical protein